MQLVFGKPMKSLQNNITLDVDEVGIWLVEENHKGDEVCQLGHISWHQVYIYLKKYEQDLEKE